MTEIGVDIIFYLSWIYLSAIVIFEIFIVDMPLVLAKVRKMWKQRRIRP